MALAEIIDLDQVRRARRAPSVATAPAAVPGAWCYYWMPVYYWYLA